MAAWRKTQEEFNDALVRNGGFFCAITEAIRNICQRILDDVGYSGNPSDYGFDDDSPEWYAHEVLALFKLVKLYSSEGPEFSTDLATRYAFQAGQTWERAQMKWQWEKSALRGEKVGEGARFAGELAKSLHAPLRERRFKRMAQLLEVTGAEKAARHCEAEGLGPWQGILQQWNRFKRK